jgi:hypothetical protein
MPRHRYIDEDANGDFLDKEDVKYPAGDRDAALRALGIPPGDKKALERYLAARGKSVGKLPPPTVR